MSTRRKALIWSTLLALLFSIFIPTPAQAIADGHISVSVTWVGLPSYCSFESPVDPSAPVDFEPYSGGGYQTASPISLRCGSSHATQLNYLFRLDSDPGGAATLTFLDPQLHEFTGKANWSYPSDCNGSATADFFWLAGRELNEKTGIVTSVLTTSHAFVSPASDGHYTFMAPYGVEIQGLEVGMGINQAQTKCAVPMYPFEFQSPQSTFNIRNDVVHLNYVLEEPAGKTGHCTFVVHNAVTENEEEHSTWSEYQHLVNLNVVQKVKCDGFVHQVTGVPDPATPLVRGHEANFVFKLSDYELVDTAVSADWHFDSCSTWPISATSAEGYTVGPIEPVAGVYNMQLPRGTWTFTGGSQQSVCYINQTEFVGSGASEIDTVSLHSNVARIRINLTQPTGRSDCSLNAYDELLAAPGRPVNMDAETAVAMVSCGDYSRAIRFDLPPNLSATALNDVNLAVPDFSMRTVSGAFTVPATFKALDRSKVHVMFVTPTDQADLAQSGWMDLTDASIVGFGSVRANVNWDTMTYSATLPTGGYTVAITTGEMLAADDRHDSCYQNSYYVQGGAPTWTSQFATRVDISSGLAPMTGPALALTRGRWFDVRFTWPLGSPSSPFRLDLANADKRLFGSVEAQSGAPYFIGGLMYVSCFTPGTYYMRISGEQISTQYFGGGSTIATARALHVNADGTSDSVHFSPIKKNVSSITGRLVDAAGNPMTNFTVHALSSSGVFTSARVGANGSFTLAGLESPATYSLVAADNNQFSMFGAGGKKFAFYGGTHDEETSNLLSLTKTAPNIDNLVFVYEPAVAPASPNDVLPVFRFATPSSPVASLLDVRAQVDRGQALLADAPLVSSDTDGTLNVSQAMSFDGLEDSLVDIFVVGSDSNVTPSSVATSSIMELASTPKTVKYLGKASIVNNQVVLPAGIPAKTGLNQVILRGASSHDIKVVPLVVGRTAPQLVRTAKFTTTAVVGRSLNISSMKWVSNPTSISYSYQWMRCTTATTGCLAIAGATKAIRGVETLDRNKYLRLRVTAKNVVGSTQAYFTTTKVR